MRPFNCKIIALDIRAVKVMLKCKRINPLTSALPDRCHGHKFPGNFCSGLFFKFPERRLQWRFFISKFSLGNGPCSLIFIFPEWPTGMDDEHLRNSLIKAV